MARPKNKSLPQRNQEIYNALYIERRPIAELTREFGLERASLYRAARSVASESFAAQRTPGGGVFEEIGSTGLRRFGGNIVEEYDRAFRSLNKRVALYKQMGDDAIVASVLQAIRMRLRRVGWHVEAGGESEGDKQAADFLQTCLDDMSQTWGDTIDQALDMLQFGFQVSETVYKRREGPKEEAGSKYDDGRIGWRKWIFISPDSLASGDEWKFDENGGIQGVNQYDMYRQPTVGKVFIPIDKAILFRTTAQRNNPEGRSLLRAMYGPYFLKRGLEDIEAISAERLGTGFPVLYAGSDVGKGTGANSDLETLKNIVRNVRTDEQMGLFLPWAKMGAGAEPGKGILFELVSPPGRGGVDFNQVITRHSQHLAMTGLAQFIHLGMAQVGARSLGESSQDFFTLAIEAWADGLADTINRYGVDRLMKLNNFPGLTANPMLVHDSVSGNNLPEIAAYINQLSQARLITPSLELEQYLREAANLPYDELAEAYEKKAQEVNTTPAPFPPQPAPEDETMPEIEQEEEVEESSIMLKRKRGPRAPDTFAMARVAENLAAEIRAARLAITGEANGTQMETFAQALASMVNQVPAVINVPPTTVLVTNEVKPAPVIMAQPVSSTEQTTVNRDKDGNMTGSTTRVTHDYGGE